MRISFIIAGLLSICSLSRLKAEIPIVACKGVLPQESTIERFMELKEAGFDVSCSNFVDMPTSHFIKAMDNAHACGIRLFALSTELWQYPEKTVRRIMGHPALYGYFLRDEPLTEKDFADAENLYRRISAIDGSKPFYLNLVPYYDDALLQTFGIESYAAYVRRGFGSDIPQICFDYYPITEDGIRDNWYYNLELIRKESIRSKKEFWGYILSTPHADYPVPTLSMLRLQAYSNLVYGAKALWYFTYWTPPRDDNFIFHDGPIGLDGKRTGTYDVVKRMNKELRAVRELFDGAVIESVRHAINVPYGTSKYSVGGKGMKVIVSGNDKGAVISSFSKAGRRYIAVVNKSYMERLYVQVRARDNVRHITKSLKPEKLKGRYTLSGGDIAIFSY